MTPAAAAILEGMPGPRLLFCGQINAKTGDLAEGARKVLRPEFNSQPPSPRSIPCGMSGAIFKRGLTSAGAIAICG